MSDKMRKFKMFFAIISLSIFLLRDIWNFLSLAPFGMIFESTVIVVGHTWDFSGLEFKLGLIES
jgi:hypothetical protein